ncbi:MAG TPA: glycosyltransferase [Candidatus Gastranaerophilales bacterium]|nr:glycosyltransferase [Candidatus Gastranaerophilales bacterium]
MKKIAVISNTFPPYSGGGVATAQYNILKKFQEAGFEVKGFTFYDHGKIKLKEQNIVRCGSPKLIFRTINTLTKNYFAKSSKKDCATSNEYAWQWNFTVNSAIGCWKINRELKKFMPDIIIMPDLGTPNYYINKPHENCKIVMISHHNAMRFINNPLIDKHSVLDAKLVNNLENKGMKNIDSVICPSNYMKKVFMETHEGYNKPIEVIPNLINEKLIQHAEPVNIRQELNLPADAPLIYLPAANTPVKGPRYMFEIIRRLAGHYREPIGFYLSALKS